MSPLKAEVKQRSSFRLLYPEHLSTQALIESTSRAKSSAIEAVIPIPRVWTTQILVLISVFETSFDYKSMVCILEVVRVSHMT